MSEGRPPATTAQSPFDDANADLVLHTSDHVDFHVFRCVLALSSPLFQSMFTLPQPPSTSHANASSSKRGDQVATPPSVGVSEDSLTLDTLLRFLYPNTRVPKFHDILHARNVATAASKYTMSVVLDRIGEKVREQYVSSYPFEVYFIAHHMGWHEVAAAAARYCIDVAPHTSTADDGPEGDALVKSGTLDYPGAGVAYLWLEAYRHACNQALKRVTAAEVRPIQAGTAEENRAKRTKRDNVTISLRCLRHWIVRYRENIAQELAKHPMGDSFDELELAPKTKCDDCDIEMMAQIGDLRAVLTEEIEEALSKVELRIS